MNPIVKIFCVAALGSLFQELLHISELRKRSTDAVFKKQLRSPSYYICAVLMIAVSGAVIATWYGDDPQHLRNSEIMVLGAAAPALFKKAVSAAARRSAHAGAGPTAVGGQLRRYFMLS